MAKFGASCLGGGGKSRDHEDDVVPYSYRQNVDYHPDAISYPRLPETERYTVARDSYYDERDGGGDDDDGSERGSTSTSDGNANAAAVVAQLSFDNFTLIKQTHYTVVRDGREYFDRYVVTYRLPDSRSSRDLFTYSEGLVHVGPIENAFPHLCGEVLFSHSLPPANSLGVCHYYVSPTVVDSGAPFHVQEEAHKSNGRPPAVPVRVDTAHQVLVFRTYHDTLALQLMPTVFSERRIVSGTPLFHGVKKSVCASVGTAFTDYYYVVNGSPCVYALFAVGGRDRGDPVDGDRMRLIVLDRRDRVESKEWSADDAVLHAVSDVASPVVQRVEGKQSRRLDARDVLYVGVVNSTLQVTDAPNVASSKKYKPPRNSLVVVIDDAGVYATQVRDAAIVAQWVQKDTGITYSVLPRQYFDRPRTGSSGTAVKMKRAKSREMLV